MSRGDVVTVALQGAFGNPRPVIVIQSDLCSDPPSVTVLPMTSDIVSLPLIRISIEPTERNGLRKPSQIMVDKVQTVSRQKIGRRLGRLTDSELFETERALATFLGFT